MTFILCSSGAAVEKSGAYHDRVFDQSSGAQILNDYYSEVEGQIVSATRRDWASKINTIASGARQACADCASDLMALKILAYNPTGYSLAVAQTMFNLLTDNAIRNLTTLKEFSSNEIKDP